MLQRLKTHSRGIIGWAIIIILVLAFGAWGLADVAVQFTSDTVARLGGERIRANEFRAFYANRLNTLSADMPQPISAEQGRNLGLDAELLDELLDARALSQGAADMGLRIPDEAIAEVILENSSFFGPSGKFDEPTFRHILANNGLTEKIYVADQRGFYLRQQLFTAFDPSGFLPSAIAREFYDYDKETRTARYIRLTADMIGRVEDPDEGALLAFYTASRMRWNQAERRSATLLTLDPETFARRIKITSSELRNEFERVSAQYASPEKREVDQLMLPDAATESQVRELLDGGGDFEDFVEAAGQTDEGVDLGLVERGDFIIPELAQAAFALEKDAVSEIIETPLGAALLRVRKIVAAKESRFRDVRDELRERMREERLREELYAFYQNIEDELAASASFEDLAEQFDLELTPAKDIDRDGLDKDGERVQVLDVDVNLVATIFSSAVKENIPPIETDDGTFYWVRVDEITPSRIAEFEAVQDDVLKAWQENRQREMLDTLARSLVERGEDGDSLALLAKPLEAEVKETNALTRNGPDDVFTPQALDVLFGLRREGDFGWAFISGENEAVLLELTNKTLPERPDETANDEDDTTAEEDNDTPAPDPAFDSFAQNARAQFRADVTKELMRSLRAFYGEEIDENALRAASGSL